ncbi:hypothetical protein LCGC14_2997040 [marine sediment metagenome]|uniref:Sulfotransferase domain-containing protein n=1 Tax=marine sediment metagenome TaxID=412755 RepID=A0A0F8Z9N7_9ZZZZ
MNNIRLISYPKSGQHLLVQCLLRYFSRDLNYPFENRRKDEGSILIAGQMGYCEKGLHCNEVPCREPAVNFQAMHDCHKLWYNEPSVNHIILYRNPIYIMLSLCNYEKNGIVSLNNYLRYFIGYLNEWKEWIHKWAIKGGDVNAHQLAYEDFLNEPLDTLYFLIKFIDCDNDIDREHLIKVIQSMDICQKHKLIDFHYYEHLKEQMKQLEDLIASELETLNIPKVEWI